MQYRLQYSTGSHTTLTVLVSQYWLSGSKRNHMLCSACCCTKSTACCTVLAQNSFSLIIVASFKFSALVGQKEVLY